MLFQGDAEAVKELLDQGADPNMKDNAGWTPLVILKQGLTGGGKLFKYSHVVFIVPPPQIDKHIQPCFLFLSCEV